MLSNLKFLIVAGVLAFSFACGASAQETGGVPVPDQPSEYSAQEQEPETEVSFWDRCKAAIGGACSVLTGVDPFAVNDAVEIVAENSESLAETRDNAEAYFDAYEDAPDRARYTLENEDLSDKPAPGIYEAFWSLFE